MKTPFRELRLHQGLVELLKALQRLHEGSTKALRSNRGGAGAFTKWMRRDSVMERSRGLYKASVVAKASRWLHEGFVEPLWLLAAPLWSLRVPFAKLWNQLRATGNSPNNDRPWRLGWGNEEEEWTCLLYTSPSPRDA